MPRAAQSQVGSIVAFFRTSDLAVADLVLDLCKDALRERQQKSEKARARAKETVGEAAMTSIAAAAPRKAKGARKKPGPKPRKSTAAPTLVDQAGPALPLDLEQGQGDLVDAGDLVGALR